MQGSTDSHLAGTNLFDDFNQSAVANTDGKDKGSGE